MEYGAWVEHLHTIVKDICTVPYSQIGRLFASIEIWLLLGAQLFYDIAGTQQGHWA
jgi:hypothetical protein